jgi:hypothetical protein
MAGEGMKLPLVKNEKKRLGRNEIDMKQPWIGMKNMAGEGMKLHLVRNEKIRQGRNEIDMK